MESKRNIEKKIRIYDDSIWEQLDKLENSKQFESFNDLLNKALKLGVPLLYEHTFDFDKYYKTTKANDIEDTRVRDIMLTCDEMHVTINILKHLIATLYNIEVAKIDGIALLPEMVSSGLLSALPPALQDIEDSMLESISKRRQKK